MPYLSWMEGTQLVRQAVHGPCQLGRDALACEIARPSDGTLSRVHAALTHIGDIWWIRDLDSANGTLQNGATVTNPQGQSLEEGDQLTLGDWVLTFTMGYPGLDGVTFAERVGDLFQEVRPEPAQALLLIRGVELLYRSTEALFRRTDSDSMVRGLLDEALSLLGGDRGFLVMRQEEGGWQTAHRIGEVQEGIGLSRTVLDYVYQERTAVLSNRPLVDPRFGGMSLVEMHRGALLCAPMLDEGKVLGIVYLDRESDNRPFSRFDLAIFHAFVTQGSLALRQAMLNRKVLTQAEQQGELLRLRTSWHRETQRHAELLAAIASPFRHIQSWASELPEAVGGAILSQLLRVSTLLEEGGRESLFEEAPAAGHSLALGALQETLIHRWKPLMDFRNSILLAGEAHHGSVWMAGGPLETALDGLVEPILVQLAPGAVVSLRWDHSRDGRILRLALPPGLHGPMPDPWTRRTLNEAGVQWKWGEQTLDVILPEGPDAMPEEPARPLLGLVSDDLDLVGLFQSVADAGELCLHPLEEDPPQASSPRFRFLVVDAKGTKNTESCIRSYRRHPSFSTTPILVVRCTDDTTPGLIQAGATDWLAEGFRWEALHHRLQVLRGHTELQQRALASERLESFRQMAGTLKHEINNPLAIISMQVEMLQRKYPDEPKFGKIGEMVDRIRALVQVLQKMRETPTEGYADGSSILKLG